MSVKPDFVTMTTTELRAYVLEHRDDKEVLRIFLDRLHAENPNPRVYTSEDNIADAITEYLQNKNQKKV